MHPIRWYRLIALGVLAAPIAARAQGPQPQVREIATIPGVEVGEFVRHPNGRVLLYTVGDSIVAYDLSSKQSTLITRGFFELLRVAPAGDRIVYCRRADIPGGELIWSMPINPTTGAAAGPAQRVSLTAGDYPSFSPDGKTIAFNRNSDNRGQDLAVVPATGGPERIVAKYGAGMKHTSWSADGRWIYVEIQGKVPNQLQVERVPVTGGRSEPLFSHPASVEGNIDAQLALYPPVAGAWQLGRMGYVATTGARGEFKSPLGARPGDGVGSSQFLLVKTMRAATAHRLNLADGRVQDLISGDLQSRAEAWSPDGRRIALQTGTSERLEITVMNADGTQPRRYPIQVFPNSTQLRWSPDGQRLVYYADGGAATLAVLDVATGKTRVASSAAPDGWIPDFRWRPDGKSIVLVKYAALGAPTAEVVEARLDGTERKLRDVGAEFPARPFFISDQLLLGGTRTETFAIPTFGGPAKHLSGTGRRNPFPGISSDGKWLLLFIRNDNGDRASIDLMTSSGDSLRTLRLPFEFGACCWNAPFHPDGRHLILGGTIPGESVTKLFLVPLNGDPPRALAQFPRLNGPSYLSPDGSTLVFTTEGPPTSTIYELDLSPILKAVGRHQP